MICRDCRKLSISCPSFRILSKGICRYSTKLQWSIKSDLSIVFLWEGEEGLRSSHQPFPTFSNLDTSLINPLVTNDQGKGVLRLNCSAPIHRPSSRFRFHQRYQRLDQISTIRFQSFSRLVSGTSHLCDL